MKKAKLLVLAAMSALLLAGCAGGQSSGTLPSGGKEEKVTEEAGKATLKSRLNSTKEAYEKLEVSGVQLTASASGVNLSAKANAESPAFGKIAIDANLKDLGGNATVVAAKDKDGKLAMSAEAKLSGGSLSLKGQLPGEKPEDVVKFDSSLSLKGPEAKMYLTGDKAYVDASSSGNTTFVGNVDKFGNKLLEDMSKSPLGALISMVAGEYLNAEGKLDLSSSFAKVEKKFYTTSPTGAIDWPLPGGKNTSPVDGETGPVDGETDPLDSIVEGIAQVSEQLGLKFVTYSNGSYGFQLGMTKESLVKFVKETEKDADLSFFDYVNKLSFNAAILFNKEFLLESFSCSLDFAAKMDLEGLKKINGDAAESFTAFNAEVNAKASAKAELKYGTFEVKLPSDLSSYKELQNNSDSEPLLEGRL